MFDDRFLARYNDKVDKQDISGCWFWTAARLLNGYGVIGSGTGKTNLYAHRVALEMKLGRKLLPGMDACHSCRNRNCVAPHHLREGTRKDNMMDKLRDGTLPRGSAVKTAKLTEEQVRAIREDTRKLREIAADLDMNLNTIWKIKHRHMWAWLE